MHDITLDDSLQVPSDVLFRQLHGEAVLLNIETGVYYGLDPVGARAWELIVEHGALQRVYAAMLDEYDVEPPRLAEDLLQLAGQLREQGLVTVGRQ